MRFVAALDPPAETKRQFLTLLLWLVCLGSAVFSATCVGTRVSDDVDPLTLDASSEEARSELARSHAARMKVALFVGLAAPAVLTLLLSRRHRRHGAHPRGITVETTDTELRLWGRGYGSRVAFDGASVDERLVDVYAGRLGAWRQIRLRVRTKSKALELAAPAIPSDEGRGLRHEGAEADCVELERADYEALKLDLDAKVAEKKGSKENGEEQKA